MAPAIHTKKRGYRVVRALNSALAGRKVVGLEGEVSDEVRRLSPGKRHVGAFSLPIDPSDDLRDLMYPGYQERSDLTTSTGVGGIFTVPELPWIDLLRSKMVLGRLGCTMLTGMPGPFGIPRASGQNAVNWIAEGSPATADTPTIDAVDFSPSVAVNLTNISRRFLASNSVRSEAFVIEQGTRNLAVALDGVAIDGQGAGADQPSGLMLNSSIISGSSGLAIGTNGGAVAWTNVLALEKAVSEANADVGRLGYVGTPQLRAALKATPRIAASTTGLFCWEGGSMNGYPAEATNLVPSSLTKGSASGLSALIFGDWSSLIVATFHDGVDVVVNPFSGQASASVTVSLVLSCDVGIAHPESFRMITDAAAA